MVRAKLIFMLLVLVVPLVSAGDVAYVYDKEGRIDQKIVGIFEGLNLSVDFVNDTLADLSDYKLVFVGDDNSAVPGLNKYPSVVVSYSLGEETGFTDKDGTSKMASTQPLKVKFKGSDVQVYTSGRDSRGIAIPYYFLDNENKAGGLLKYAGTYSTSSGKDFGDVISFASQGTVLSNGDVVGSSMCFFGIVKSDYWTSEAESLFLDCVKFVYDYTYVPPQDVACYEDNDCVVFSMLDSQPFCEGSEVVQNYTSPMCVNPGTEGSFCEYRELTRVLEECSFCVGGECGVPSCEEDGDCDDGFLFTEDVCLFPGTENSTCSNDFKNDLELITVFATSTPSSITLNFYHNYSNMSGIKGYYLSDNGVNWTFLGVMNSSYTFSSLGSDREYNFTVQIVDYFDLIIQEMVLALRTSSVPQTSIIEVASGGGGGGGGCITEWECSEWGVCENNIQTRVCSYPEGHCEPYADKPLESQACAMPFEGVSESSVQEPEGVEPVTEEIKNSVSPITGASVGVPDVVSSDFVILVSAIALMGLITLYFLLSSPKVV